MSTTFADPLKPAAQRYTPKAAKKRAMHPDTTELFRRFRAIPRGGPDRLALRSELMAAYVPLLHVIANSVWRSVPSQVDPADLEQAGVFGLVEAIESFDPSRGIKFQTFSQMRIRGAILDWLRDTDWVPRSERKRARKDAGHAITEMKSFDGSLGWDTDRNDTMGTTIPDRRASNAVAAVDGADQFQRMTTGLTRGERAAITLYYRDGLNMREIGGAIGLGESRVSQMIADVIRRMKRRAVA